LIAETKGRTVRRPISNPNRDSLGGSPGQQRFIEARSVRGESDQGAGEMPKTVLIVEDNELNMKLFSDLLEANGYGTVQTRNGVEAVGLARRHMPDLILMDIQLPEVSGLQVTQWLKDDEELRHIPIVAITAFAMKGDEEKIRQGGCEAYLSKPISVARFLETVRNYAG
jgi:two-component system, cell cycle response regulator DivK